MKQMQAIFPTGDRFDPIDLSSEQSGALSAKAADVDSVYLAKTKDGETIGYIFLSSANGYAGKVNASIGIGVDGKIVMAAFMAPDETPGLGKRIEEDKFSSAFTDLATEVPVAVASSGEMQSIDAVSGATISSKGAVEAVNKSFRAFLYLSAEGSL